MSTSKKLALLLIAALAIYAYTSFSSAHTPEAHGAPAPQTLVQYQAAPGEHSVFGAPSLSAQAINAILCQAQSPACGTGQALYEYGAQAGIDPAYALAFFNHESSFGKAGIARVTRALGNIRCTPGYACYQGFRAYNSWQAGYQDWYALIAWYARELHKSTVEQIVPTYAPASENDPGAYIQAVVSSVSAWHTAQQEAGK